MKLFVYTPNKPYTWGSTIIAAHNQKEADAVLAAADILTPVSFSEVLEGVYAKGKPRVIEDTSGEE